METAVSLIAKLAAVVRGRARTFDDVTWCGVAVMTLGDSAESCGQLTTTNKSIARSTMMTCTAAGGLVAE